MMMFLGLMKEMHTVYNSKVFYYKVELNISQNINDKQKENIMSQ